MADEIKLDITKNCPNKEAIEETACAFETLCERTSGNIRYIDTNILKKEIERFEKFSEENQKKLFGEYCADEIPGWAWSAIIEKSTVNR